MPAVQFFDALHIKTRVFHAAIHKPNKIEYFMCCQRNVNGWCAVTWKRIKSLLNNIKQIKSVQIDDPDFIICSNCFRDEGLRIDAARFGSVDNSVCVNCGTTTGRKLTSEMILGLAHSFFVWGTIQRFDYGAAAQVQFNEHQATSISTSPWFEADVRLIEKSIGVGFFYYGPRLWMVGEVEPLKSLQKPETKGQVIDRIIDEYPVVTLSEEQTFYRIRKGPANPANLDEYDSPPIELSGSGRLDAKGFPVMYASPDIEVCVHECRVTAEDDLFVATLAPARQLKLLNLTELLQEQDTTEFESLDMAVHMLFLAGEHSYSVARDISLAAKNAQYDGIIYPSYFGLLRTGGMPFETMYGISHRMVPGFADRERAKTIPNLALFGRPIEQEAVRVLCVNRLVLNRVEYGIHFGPVGV